MEKKQTHLYSSVNQDLLVESLYRGSIVAAVGAFLLIFAGTSIPMMELSHVGWLIFLVGGSMIAFGLIPYVRWRALQNQPNHLLLTWEDSVIFSQKGKELYRVPLSAIDRIEYYEKKQVYGVRVWLKEEESVQWASNINEKRYLADMQKIHHCDLFFPFFSRRAYFKLESAL